MFMNIARLSTVVLQKIFLLESEKSKPCQFLKERSIEKVNVVHAPFAVRHMKTTLVTTCTTTTLSPEVTPFLEQLTRNAIVVMDELTHNFLVEYPVQGRTTIVLTASGQVRVPEKLAKDRVHHVSLRSFETVVALGDNVVIIGGQSGVPLGISSTWRPDTWYVIHVDARIQPPATSSQFVPLPPTYELVYVSEPLESALCTYRALKYKYRLDGNGGERQYLSLLQTILETGEARCDRTGHGTRSVFGRQLHIDIHTTVPLLTTKRVAWKHCIEELLWFLRGDTDAKVLQRKGVRIWDGNTSRAFLDGVGLYDYPEGVLGPGYGWQWRFFGALYDVRCADTSVVDTTDINGVDQLEWVVSEIKRNPTSRRLLVSAWNPQALDATALPPCHFCFQFYVRGNRYLDCHFVMRSNDVFLGAPFNLFSYAVLTYIVAVKCNLEPGKLVYTCSDAHVYASHVEAARRQLIRTARPLPALLVRPEVRTKDFADISVEDFDLVGYHPCPAIKAPMAV